MKIVLTHALANAADGAFITDEDQHITFWNRAAEEILGYRYEEVSRIPCYEVLDAHDDNDRPICHQHCRVAATALAGGAVTNFDACVRIKLGGARWINVSTFAAPANDGTAGPAIVHLFRDVTKKSNTNNSSTRCWRQPKICRARFSLRPSPQAWWRNLARI